MKTQLRSFLLHLAVVSSCCLFMLERVTAQTFTILYDFKGGDGAGPCATLVLSEGILYGTTKYGGSWSNGTVFAVHTDGTGFTNLHCFSAVSGSYPFYYNSDGAKPSAGLILSTNTLYGTAEYGGQWCNGTVFGINTDGAGFTNLHSFTALFGDRQINYDGANPVAGLVLLGDNLYGTTCRGGDPGIENFGNGTLFKGKLDGTAFTSVYSFNPAVGAFAFYDLVLSGNTFYGTAATGGGGGGTVYKMNVDGNNRMILASFGQVYGGATNSGGSSPHAGLVLRSNTLFGTAAGGGSMGHGTIFAVGTNGGFETVYNFTGGSDGASPMAVLLLAGNTLFGTSAGGGNAGNGTVFSICVDGTGFTVLHSFSPLLGAYPGTNSDGAHPRAGLVFSCNSLYGTTQAGGSSGLGTVFRLSLSLPQLEIIPHGSRPILTWPTDGARFTLQSAPAVTGTFTNIPGATSPYTNPITGAQQFFRLKAN